MRLRRCLAAVLVSLAVPAAASGARTVHVDCEARGPGDGSARAPLTSLAEAGAVELGPADALLLRRGRTCAGTLVPRVTGSAREPARIGAYGPRRADLPRIVAGPADADALLLAQTHHVVVEDLDLSAPGDGSAKKRGVHVTATDGVVRSVTLRRLRIHDVGGNLDKDAGGSGGIQVSAYGSGARFAGLTIEDTTISEVSRSGIFIGGTTDPGRPRASEPWPAASTDVVVRGNVIEGLAGDGIVPVGTVGARIEDNVVRDGNRAGRSPFDPAGMICNAGIWAFHANGTVIARNEVSDFTFNGCDGTAFDVDYDTDATVIEHNYSHDNEGGFLLLCTEDVPRTADVRFNLSVDDGATLHESPCALTPEGFTGTLDGIRIFANTWVAPKARILSPLGREAELPALLNAGTLEFRDNLVVSTSLQATPLPCGTNCSHNHFSGLPPSGTDASLGDPRFADAARRGDGRLEVGRGFALRPGSPAIGTGVALADPGRADYFGTPLAVGAPHTRGMHQPR